MLRQPPLGLSVNIEVIRTVDPENRRVQFTSPAGSASGMWCDELEPQPGNYDVEFEIVGEVQRWDHAQPSRGRIEDAGDRPGVSITGMVERVDEDFTVALRVQSDILLIETPEHAPPVAPGTYLCFTVSCLELYPYQL
ncbi:hypothetical protein GCM10010359_35730 [Streptomyces morookaense]|nr:hypothetical protein GCM10010359_35730 [Streptomyces morookaense]